MRGRENGNFEVKKAVDFFPRTNGLIFRGFDIHLEQSSHIECVALLVRQFETAKTFVNVSLDMDMYRKLKEEQR